MKIKASISQEIEIDNNFIIDFAKSIAGSEKPEISETSDEYAVKDFFENNHANIIAYARETVIDWLAERCDEVALKGNYDIIVIDQIK